MTLIKRGMAWYRRITQLSAAVLRQDRDIHTYEARQQPVPRGVVRVNAAFFPPYVALRSGLTIRYLGNRFSSEQPASLWFDSREPSAGPFFLDGRIELSPDDAMVVHEDPVYDLSVGTPMVKVLHERARKKGFITISTLVSETTEAHGDLWVAQDKAQLRSVVELLSADGVLYSTNRLSPREVTETMSYLEQFSPELEPRPDLARDVHPLQAGAHAHRLGVWALATDRDPADRARAAALIQRMFDLWGIPCLRSIEGSAAAWPYRFDFAMPWGTKLRAPWYSGYANAAMVGAAACAWRLTENAVYKDIATRGLDFLRLPMNAGGALYESDGFRFVAEYCYASPPIPNYRVLDGELCSVIFLYNAALLLGDARTLDFVLELGPGLANVLDMFCARDGLPAFGMDGQAMTPDYMWQLWVTLQLLANIFKDRRFTNHAKRWRAEIPQHLVDDGYPV